VSAVEFELTQRDCIAARIARLTRSCCFTTAIRRVSRADDPCKQARRAPASAISPVMLGQPTAGAPFPLIAEGGSLWACGAGRVRLLLSRRCSNAFGRGGTRSAMSRCVRHPD
jgi:hypothetical protein